MRDTVIFVVILSPIISYGFRLAKYKRPQRWKPGPVIQEENAAPHHEWDSTIKAFRSFKANLREVYVIGLAVAEAGWCRACRSNEDHSLLGRHCCDCTVVPIGATPCT
jgi:hypothetical protein